MTPANDAAPPANDAAPPANDAAPPANDTANATNNPFAALRDAIEPFRVACNAADGFNERFDTVTQIASQVLPAMVGLFGPESSVERRGQSLENLGTLLGHLKQDGKLNNENYETFNTILNVAQMVVSAVGEVAGSAPAPSALHPE